MALSNPRSLFGIHSMAFYNTTTRAPYGIVKVAKGANLQLSGETVELTGGSFRYPWDIQDGLISTEMSLTFAEYPDFLFEVLLGKAPTNNTSETTGDVTAGTNVNGTTIINASNGISAVTATSSDQGDLKFGIYTIVAKTGDTFDVYCTSDVDFARGTDLVYIDDALRVINDGDVSSAAHVDAATGLTFTPAGTPAFTAGNTATFEVRPINATNMEVTIGGVSDVFPEFGAIVYAQKKGDTQLFEIDLFRCKAIGMPIALTPQEFSEAEVTVKAFYDSTRSGIMKIRSIDTF